MHLPILWKRSFQLGSTLFPTNSYDDLHLPTLWEEEFSNYDLFFSYKFRWRSASAYSLEEEFSIRIYSFLSLQIAMTICNLPSLWRRSFQLGSAPFPTNSYDDLHLPILWKRSFQLGSALFLQIPYDDLHLVTLSKRSFQLGSIPFLQIPMTICTWLLFGRGVFH